MATKGDVFVVPATNLQDIVDATAAAAQNKLVEEANARTFRGVFGEQSVRSVSPDRKHTYRGSISMGSTLRAHPYTRTNLPRTAFYDRPNGEEYMKSDMKCAEGHIPRFAKDQLPFLSYGHLPQTACSRNGTNKFLVWDDAKSKYCCHDKSDPMVKIMERSLQNIYNMVTKSDIHYKSLPYLEAAIDKYLFYYDMTNNKGHAALITETDKINTLISELTTELSTEREKKSHRYEQWDKRDPLMKAKAIELFNKAYPDFHGGRSKKHNSKSRTKKPKPKSKSKRTKSRKPKSRKSKRRY
jgi:hypothetical protein